MDVDEIEVQDSPNEGVRSAIFGLEVLGILLVNLSTVVNMHSF